MMKQKEHLMTNFSKGFAFLLFGVLCSPIMLGTVPALIAWDVTESVAVVVIATIFWFSAWGIAYEWMKARKWHHHLT